MKKLDDLVFKNLHGLRDEDDQVKHKHDNKSLDNFSSDPQQQQQQMMYNYYNNNYATNMASQQYGNQGGMNQAFMQNMQYQQGANQANMGGMGNQNAYRVQQMNQYSQGNWNNAAQNQMQAGNKIPNILHPSQNPNFAQMNPMMQKQYLQMYQMAQLQMQQMKQAQNAFPNQGSFQNQQNTGNIQNPQQQYYQQSGGMGLNQGINPSYGNQAKQPSQGFNNFGSFTSNQNANAQFDDDFADFQTSGNSNQRNQVDDFDDFQGAPVTAPGKGGQQQFDEGFDDFQDASITTAPQSTANEPKNWDILDDFVEKKPPTQPQAAQNPAPQQMYGNVQNLNAQQAQYLQNQAVYQNNMFAQQQNFGGVPAQQNTNANDNDDFEDFEEAKPSQVTKPKSPTKEDLMFGALESKAIKHMGLENIISHPTPTPVDDFGDFGAFSTTNTVNLPQTQNQDLGGDDFQDFEDAGPTKPHHQEIVNNPPPQEHKKLTIYDIDLAEFGITETTQGPHLTEPIKEQSLPEPPKQQHHEDFGDFVEVNEEKPSQSFGLGAPNELNFGENNNETEKRADASGWGFDNPAEPTANVDHNDFGDFEEPQIAGPQTNQPAADAFDDFQEVAATNQKEIGKSWEHIDFPPVESQPKETQDGGDFRDFEEHVSAPVQQPQTQVKADEEFGDFDFPVTAAPKQDTLFEDFTGTPAPPSHTQNIATEEKPNAFDDFEEFSSPTGQPENPKVEVQEVKKVEEEHDEFGDFGEQEPQTEAEPEQKMQIEEIPTTTSNPKQQVEKKLSVYDMDWAEFGIEEKNQNAPPPMQFHFGGFEGKSGQDEKKTPVSGGQALTDLYSLYGNTNVTTPVAAEQGEDPFAGAQGAVIQEEKQEDQDDFDDFEKPKPAADPQHENDGFDDFEAAPNKDDDAFDFGNQNQNQNQDQDQGNDDFADFADFEAAPQESKTQNQAFEDPFFFHQQEPQQPKEENLFGDFSAEPTKIQEVHHNDDFGGFEHGSQDEAHHQEVFSDFQEPKQANPVEEQHEDDGFDDFADAGLDNKKQAEVETPVKSLSHIGGAGLYHDNSDYGSLSEVQHHQQTSAQNNPVEAHDFDFKKKTSPTREDALGKRVHDDFGSFNDADNADNQSREAPEPDHHHHKDESIFHRAESSDYTPQNKKDESAENDDFGDFVGSKQDLPKEEAEAERVPPSPPRESFNYTLESVLDEYGIKAGQENYAEKEEKNSLEEEIEKRIEEITQEFEEKLVKSTLMRAAVKKEKFKLNSEMVEELAQELKSLQKYKEAILIEGQTKIIAEIKELNQTKARLIDEDELEEAVKYKDLVKNKEKEQIPKQKFEEFLSYYDNAERKDYRLALLGELRAANVPNKYINYFYIRFLGRTILPPKEVLAEETTVENQPEDLAEPAQAATTEVQEEQPVIVQEDNEVEANENKDEIKADAEEQQPLEAEKEDAQVEKVETGNQQEEGHVEEAESYGKKEEQNEQVDEKPSKEEPEEAQKPEEDEFKFEEAEAEDKKDESQKVQKPEANDEPETQPEKAVQDANKEDEAPKQQEDEFGDFGELEEPAQKQDDEEKVEKKVEENQEEKEENNQTDDQPENKQQEEGEQGDDGFGAFDQPEVSKKSEEDDFKFEEGEEKEKEEGEESKPQEEQGDDGFGDFDDKPHVTEKQEDNDFKFEEGEEKESKPQEEQGDDGFGDFDDKPQVAKKPEDDDNDFKFDEAKDDKNDEFGDFDQPQVAEKQEDNDFKFEEGEEKEEGKESKPHEEQGDDGFGDFDDKPQVVKKLEDDNDDFKFDDEEEKHEEEEEVSKPQEDDDGFGDFDDQPQADKKPEDKDDFKFDDKEEKDEFEDFKKPEEVQDDGFGDFDQPVEAKQPEIVHEEEDELNLEDIQTEEVPFTLKGLEEQKRRITQWSLMVKVMFAENINFNHNVRKILKQIIYEIYKFNKMTTAILQEKNKDAARAILSSQKFENYVAGVQTLQSFCSELQRAFQFIELGNKWFNKYYKAIQDLTQKVDRLKNQIREEFNKEFPPQEINQGNSKPAEWLGEVQKLDKEALRHICHLSLRLNDSQLTEHSGNYYFLPYLNFLLNIE